MKNSIQLSKALLFVCIISLFGFKVHAQSGANDTLFNTFDNGLYGDGSGFSGDIKDFALQPDGKIIVAGVFTEINGTSRNRIARLNTDGSVDLTFNPGSGFNNIVYSVALDADGKIVVGGDFTAFNGYVRNRLTRLNNDGTLDFDFLTGSGFNNTVWDITLQNDHKILVGGNFTTFDGGNKSRIARLNANGTFDNSFSAGSGFNDDVRSMAIQSDGKILVVGDFTTFNGATNNRISRLNSNGSVDSDFNSGTGFNTNALSINIQSDGKILVGGSFTSYKNVSSNRVIRLNVDGALDGTFNVGTGCNNSVLSIAVQSDGKIVLGGTFTTFNNLNRKRIIKLESNGMADLTFESGSGFSGTVGAVAILTDGKIIAAGNFISYNDGIKYRIAKLNSDGNIYINFNRQTGFNAIVRSIKIDSNQKIIAVGDFTAFNDIKANGIARLNMDGTLDQTFNTGNGFNLSVISVEIQSDGKILVSGNFTAFNGENRNRIVRLNSNGSLDATFNSGNGANNTIWTMGTQQDGKIIVGGSFSSFDGVGRNRIARLNADGSLDLSFNPISGGNLNVFSHVMQNDKIIIGGDFTAFNGQNVNRIARLNADGSLDESFTSGTGFNNTVNSLSIQADGKILAGGSFTSFNGFGVNRLTRLNSDGSFDANFNLGNGFNSTVRSIFVRTDNRILVGGDFTLFNSAINNRIVLLNPNGTLNADFNTGTGCNGAVCAINAQSDSKIILGGEFRSYNGAARTRISRLFGGELCETVQGTDIISSCEPITWIDGNTYDASNSTATHLLPSAAQNGCDSLVTLNFTLWPCTQLQPGHCNSTNVTMDQTLRAVNMNAPAYRFKITGPNNGGAGWIGNTFILDRPNRALKFSMVPGSYWGSTYNVEVAVGDGNGNFGPYGNACNVSLTSAIPTTQLQASNCGATNVSPSVNLLAVSVSGATGYRYRVNGFGVAPSTTIEKTMGGGAMRKLKMNEVAGIAQGETYTVEVAIRDAAGNWGAYGVACEVTLMGAPDFVINNDIEMMQNRNLTAVKFGVSASHNPFTTSFSLQVLNANDSDIINISIYDMSGKLIERQAINPMDIESARFGLNLAAGMYMIEVKQGSNQVVIRQVKN